MRKIISIIFLLVISASSYCYAQKLEEIGIVDFNALIMLHPKMANYEPNEKAFKTEQVIKDESSYKSFLKKQAEQLNFEVNGMKIELEKFRKDFYSQQDEKAYYFTKQLASVKDINKSEQLSKQFSKEKEKAFDDFLAREKEKSFAIEEKTKQLKNIEKKINKPGYSSQEETENILKSIVYELKKAVNVCSKKHNIQVVFNSSNERLISLYKKEIRTELPPDFSFNNILNPQKQVLLTDTTNSKDNLHMDVSKVLFYNINEDTKNWLNNENNILSNFLFVPNESIIQGGTDLTEEILDEIFSKYKIDTNISNAIKKALY